MNQLTSLTSGVDPDEPPAGYMRVSVNGRQAVACAWAAPAIRTILAAGTLHDWAASQPGHDTMHGRGVNYGVMLPAGQESGESTPVVVRRNRHGGLLRQITGEYFRPPTRAPLELANALRLTAAGVNTPELIAYALYPAFMHLVRCDVVTRRLPPGADFPDAWRTADQPTREALLEAVATLMRSLARAGAWHADLNLKNIYIAGQGESLTPSLLDVDRVTFPGGNDIADRNFSRLARSARKWRSKWGLDFGEESIERLENLSKETN